MVIACLLIAAIAGMLLAACSWPNPIAKVSFVLFVLMLLIVLGSLIGYPRHVLAQDEQTGHPYCVGVEPLCMFPSRPVCVCDARGHNCRYACERP